jgi:broad specificity phosphatase PhoE
MRRIAFCLLLLSLLCACSPPNHSSRSSADAPLTTFLLVRHAEKAADGTNDPPLTESGKLRAQGLANLLQATDIEAIYATSYQRNQQTVQPLATALSLPIQTYDPNQDAVEFLTQVMADQAGRVVLICGHSNTLPNLLNALVGQEMYQDLADQRYDDLFLCTTSALGQGAVHVLKTSPVQKPVLTE